jgi:DNA-binding CsgD family transcriptional regulator
MKEIIVELSSKGITDSEISKVLNTSSYSVKSFRLKNNIPSGRSVLISYRNQEVSRLCHEGLNFTEISKILGIPTSTVADTAHKLKIKPLQTKRSYYNNIDRIRGYMIRNSKFSAKRRNIEFDIDFTDIILTTHCPLLNTPLNYSSNFNDPFYPTLDRIDNTKGYVKGNIMILSRLANSMKNCATFSQLEAFATNIQTIIKLQGALGNVTDIFPNIEVLGERSLDS